MLAPGEGTNGGNWAGSRPEGFGDRVRLDCGQGLRRLATFAILAPLLGPQWYANHCSLEQIARHQSREPFAYRDRRAGCEPVCIYSGELPDERK